MRTRLLLAIVIAALVVVTVGCREKQPATNTRATWQPSAPSGPPVDESMAWVMAKEFLKDRLKAPATASFGDAWAGTWQSSDDHVDVLGGGRYYCHGWVDSQNSFGAMIRTDWNCVVHNTSGENWQLERITIGDETAQVRPRAGTPAASPPPAQTPTSPGQDIRTWQRAVSANLARKPGAIFALDHARRLYHWHACPLVWQTSPDPNGYKYIEPTYLSRAEMKGKRYRPCDQCKAGLDTSAYAPQRVGPGGVPWRE